MLKGLKQCAMHLIIGVIVLGSGRAFIFDAACGEFLCNRESFHFNRG